MNNRTDSYKLIYTNLPALLFILIIHTAVMPEISFGQAASPSTASQDEFAKKFREGRDLIDSEDWVKAAEKFAEITNKFPKNKSSDAALYWQAFCYKKQRDFSRSRTALERLITEFPDSSWVSDAKVMLFEVASQDRPTNRGTAPDDVRKAPVKRDRLPGGRDKTLAEANGSRAETYASFEESGRILDLIGRSLDENGRSWDENTKSLNADLPLGEDPTERDEEIKLAAFQNLFASDAKRAIELAGEVLRKDSKASEILKRQIVRSFRHSRFVKVQLDGKTQYVKATTNIAGEYSPLLRDTLKNGFQNETNEKVRAEIIYALADIDDPESVDYLLQTYNSTAEKEIKKTIILSFGGPAVSLSGTFKGTKITAVPTTDGVGFKLNFEKLIGILGAENDLELKRAAFITVQRFIRQSTNEGAIEMIARLYDLETDENFKISIINCFRGLQNRYAIAKLMDIAKNDKNTDLKFLAIYALQGNKDPEVVRFLQSLVQ